MAAALLVLGLTAAPCWASAAPKTGAMAAYAQTLSRHIGRYMRYPAAAQTRHAEGRVLMRVNIDREGYVLFSRLEQSSRNPLLDNAALQMLKNAEPLPPCPHALGMKENEVLEFLIPVQFEMDAYGLSPAR